MVPAELLTGTAAEAIEKIASYAVLRRRFPLVKSAAGMMDTLGGYLSSAKDAVNPAVQSYIDKLKSGDPLAMGLTGAGLGGAVGLANEAGKPDRNRRHYSNALPMALLGAGLGTGASGLYHAYNQGFAPQAVQPEPAKSVVDNAINGTVSGAQAVGNAAGKAYDAVAPAVKATAGAVGDLAGPPLKAVGNAANTAGEWGGRAASLYGDTAPVGSRTVLGLGTSALLNKARKSLGSDLPALRAGVTHADAPRKLEMPFPGMPRADVVDAARTRTDAIATALSKMEDNANRSSNPLLRGLGRKMDTRMAVEHGIPEAGQFSPGQRWEYMKGNNPFMRNSHIDPTSGMAAVGQDRPVVTGAHMQNIRQLGRSVNPPGLMRRGAGMAGRGIMALPAIYGLGQDIKDTRAGKGWIADMLGIKPPVDTTLPTPGAE